MSIVSILTIAIPVLVAIGLVIFAISRYKVARVDQALIITGGKEPKFIRSGGGIVWPIIRKFTFFDLCIRTIVSKGDIIKTTTGVPIAVDWTAQIRPNADEPSALKIAATSFLERDDEGISRDIKFTLDGSVREVVSDMGPEEVMRSKEEFGKRVRESVVDEMKSFGFLLVSLNIQDVDDNQGYFDDLAAKDRETRRQEAANIKAGAEQSIREKKAAADQSATESELNARVAIAAKTRDTEIQEAEFKAETDKAKADAEIAGQLRTAEREKELATNQGQIKVEQQVQENLAAEKRQAVARTEAETAKIELTIKTEAEAAKAKIDAEAAAEVKKTEATGIAEAARLQATGEADAVKEKAAAEAMRIKQTGLAEAEATKAIGLANAESIKAKGLAEAEAERALAEARAANDKVNFEVTKLEIERDTRIQVATSVAEVVANIGEKAQFIDLSGSKGSEGDLLTRVLGNVPGLMKALGVENQALNGEPLTDTIGQLVSSFVDPLKVLNKETRVIESAPTEASDVPDETRNPDDSGDELE